MYPVHRPLCTPRAQTRHISNFNFSNKNRCSAMIQMGLVIMREKAGWESECALFWSRDKVSSWSFVCHLRQ